MTESHQPSPFSREGSSPSDGLSSDNPEQTTPYQPLGDGSNDQYASHWPSYPADDPYANPSVDPYGRPVGGYGGSSADSTYTVTGPGFDPQAPPRYDPIQGYGDSSSYRNPYEANPYQPSFGGVSPYGAASTQILRRTHRRRWLSSWASSALSWAWAASLADSWGLAESSSAAGSRTRSTRSRDATPAAPRQSPVLLRALSAYRSRFWQRYSSCSRSLSELRTRTIDRHEFSGTLRRGPKILRWLIRRLLDSFVVHSELQRGVLLRCSSA